MNESRLLLLEILGFLRKSAISASGAATSLLLTLILVGFSALLIWVLPVSFNKEAIQVGLYGAALLELLIGLRVGFLKIGAKNEEYFLPTAVRYWRRSFPYLLPALLLPLPFALAAAVQLGNGYIETILLLKVFVSNYLIFFFTGSLIGVFSRIITRRTLIRIVLGAGILLAIASSLNSGFFVFESLFIFEEAGIYTSLYVLAAQLSVIVVAVLIQELLISRISLRYRFASRYWALLLGHGRLGFGQGSAQFFKITRSFVRDNALHRRLVTVIGGLLVFSGIIYALLASAQLSFSDPVALTIMMVFSAGTAMLLARESAGRTRVLSQMRPELPLDTIRLTAGAFMAALLWQIALVLVFWSLMTGAVALNENFLWISIISGATQLLLCYGWFGKIITAEHQAITGLSVFGLAVIIGLLPVILSGLVSVTALIVLQLIWLLFIVILLQVTKSIDRRVYA